MDFPRPKIIAEVCFLWMTDNYRNASAAATQFLLEKSQDFLISSKNSESGISNYVQPNWAISLPDNMNSWLVPSYVSKTYLQVKKCS